MGRLTIQVAGRDHQVACRDGEEPAIRALAAQVERHVPAARAASGGSYERTLLYLLLMLAERAGASEAREAAAAAPADDAALPADLLDRIAERLESVAQALEEPVPRS